MSRPTSAIVSLCYKIASMHTNTRSACGDHIRKWGLMRPRTLFDPEYVEAKPKRAGPRRKNKNKGDMLTSDLPTPSDAFSEFDMPTPMVDMQNFTDPFGPSEANYDNLHSDVHHSFDMQQSMSWPRSDEQQDRPAVTGDQYAPIDALESRNAADVAALQRAVQSSPARPLHHEPQRANGDEIVTPQPTRRLLFPSPRRTGEFKSLEAALSDKTKTNVPQASTTSSKKTVDGEAQVAPPTERSSETDKENHPPPFDEDDDFAHLFEEGIFQSPQATKLKTPSKAVPRTPNTKSRQFLSTGLTPRSGLTPQTGSKRNAECMGPPDTPMPMKRRSPRIAEKQQREYNKEMTPFSRSLNQLLSDGLTSSPSKVFGWTLTSSPAKDLSKTFGDMAAKAGPRS